MDRTRGVVCLGFILVSVGCVGMPASETPAAGEGPPTPSNWTSDEISDVPAETILTLSIGNESDLSGDMAAHTYHIGNNHSEPRNISITVWRDSAVVINRSVAFQSNSSIRIKAYLSGSYAIVVDPESASRHVIDDPGKWDCNELDLMANIRSDGQISGWWVQTQVNC